MAMNVPSFLKRGKVGAFLTIVMAGQLTYCSFEAFKGSLMLPLCEALGISVSQFGTLMAWVGVAMFLYVPGGWVNNRFTVRNILIGFCAWRMLSFLFVYLMPPMPFNVYIAIAFTWAVTEAIGWPAVVNGVAFMSQNEDSKGRGLAMGLLEGIRRAAEFFMNLIIIGLLAIYPDKTVLIMRSFGAGYALLLVPLILCLLKFVPKNAIAGQDAKVESSGNANVAALQGLWSIIKRPRVWLAGIAAMCIYWSYINLIYCSAPYLKLVFHASDAVSGAFGVFNTGFIGIFAGLVSGLLADYVFKSSTVMVTVALAIITIGVLLVYLLPSGADMMWPAMILLMVMAVGIFLGKAVILAPIAELNLPESINGSAMSVGSFLTYAPVFWVNATTSRIIDAHPDDPAVGYDLIFGITLIVAVVGVIAAAILCVANKRANAKAAALQTA
ncbi:MAG: MFS transporter [Corynebacterium sp.]|nr:MFS transporter [Corynebacterium sp.]